MTMNQLTLEQLIRALYGLQSQQPSGMLSNPDNFMVAGDRVPTKTLNQMLEHGVIDPKKDKEEPTNQAPVYKVEDKQKIYDASPYFDEYGRPVSLEQYNKAPQKVKTRLDMIRQDRERKGMLAPSPKQAVPQVGVAG